MFILFVYNIDSDFLSEEENFIRMCEIISTMLWTQRNFIYKVSCIYFDNILVLLDHV